MPDHPFKNLSTGRVDQPILAADLAALAAKHRLSAFVIAYLPDPVGAKGGIVPGGTMGERYGLSQEATQRLVKEVTDMFVDFLIKEGVGNLRQAPPPSKGRIVT
jgi:hypothetical protein